MTLDALADVLDIVRSVLAAVGLLVGVRVLFGVLVTLVGFSKDDYP